MRVVKIASTANIGRIGIVLLTRRRHVYKVDVFFFLFPLRQLAKHTNKVL